MIGSVRLVAPRGSDAGATHRPPVMNQAAQGKDMDSAHLDFSRAFGTVSQKIPTRPLSQVKRLRQLLLVRLEERMPRRGLTAVHQYLRGECKQDRAGSFPAAVGDRG